MPGIPRRVRSRASADLRLEAAWADSPPVCASTPDGGRTGSADGLMTIGDSGGVATMDGVVAGVTVGVGDGGATVGVGVGVGVGGGVGEGVGGGATVAGTGLAVG